MRILFVLFLALLGQSARADTRDDLIKWMFFNYEDSESVEKIVVDGKTIYRITRNYGEMQDIFDIVDIDGCTWLRNAYGFWPKSAGRDHNYTLFELITLDRVTGFKLNVADVKGPNVVPELRNSTGVGLSLVGREGLVCEKNISDKLPNPQKRGPVPAATSISQWHARPSIAGTTPECFPEGEFKYRYAPKGAAAEALQQKLRKLVNDYAAEYCPAMKITEIP